MKTTVEISDRLLKEARRREILTARKLTMPDDVLRHMKNAGRK